MKSSINLAVALIVLTIIAFTNSFAQDDTQSKFKNQNENVVKNQGEEKNVSLQFQSKEMEQVKTQKGSKFVDLDGDGICDNVGSSFSKKLQNRIRSGRQDGSGIGHNNRYGKSSDFGKHQYGTGECDGTGPKGSGKGNKGKGKN